MNLIRNLTAHDILSVDAILLQSVAPDLMLWLGLQTVCEILINIGCFDDLPCRSLDNFPADQEMQRLGGQVLRRVYVRARETTMMGARVVTLGKQLDEACSQAKMFLLK